jgi:hypothetical protein
LIAGLVLVALILLAGLGCDRRWSAWALGAVAVLWLFVNRPMEGPVLLVVTESHGLTAGDLAGLVALGLAGWRLWGRRRR